jgi:WD40 repeat protein
MNAVVFRLSLSLTLPFLFCVTTAARGQEQNPPSRVLAGHAASVVSVVFSRDGKTLVSGGRDDVIHVWDVASGEMKKTLTRHRETGKDKGDIYALAVSHDGKLMASGSMDTTIIFWDAKTFEPIRTLRGHTGAVRDVAFSPDDLTLASVSEDKTFRLWDVATGRLKVTRGEHASKVKGVVYFPDGKTIATASADATLRLWDARTGEPKMVLRGHTSGLEFCDVSPDGTQLFSGTGNIGEIIFWDAKTGKPLKILPHAHGNEHGAEIDSGRYSPDGKWAISGSKDRTDKCWDTRTFALLHTIAGNPGRTESMTFSPDGKTLATGFGGTDSHIKLWDVGAWE